MLSESGDGQHSDTALESIVLTKFATSSKLMSVNFAAYIILFRSGHG